MQSCGAKFLAAGVEHKPLLANLKCGRVPKRAPNHEISGRLSRMSPQRRSGSRFSISFTTIPTPYEWKSQAAWSARRPKEYEAWRRAALTLRRERFVIDISYVAEADETGRAALRAW